MMNKSKIDWCDFTWNPVTGCPKGCHYCYARKQSRRFFGDVRLNLTSKQIVNAAAPSGRAYILNHPFKNKQGKTIPFPAAFHATFHRYRLSMPEQKKKPANIFVCSMGDLFAPTIPIRWIKDVFDACIAAPQHSYMFLTKYPERYKELERTALLPHGNNFWYGTTVTRTDELARIDSIPSAAHRFVSIEPITSGIDLKLALEPVEWVIVGAETGNSPGKHRPYQAWLKDLVDYAHRNKIPILLKDSEELRDVWGDELIQEFPKGLEPMPTDNALPHCRQCEHASSIRQGKRGTAYACEIGWGTEIHDGQTEARHIPGRYTRSSPPWCPLRKGR